MTYLKAYRITNKLYKRHNTKDTRDYILLRRSLNHMRINKKILADAINRRKITVVYFRMTP